MYTIGWDLHQRESQLCVLDEAGTVVREQRIATSAARFAVVMPPLLPARVLVEASTESAWVASALEALGVEVVVADPRFAPMYATRSRRVKTDRRDARTLAEALLRGTYQVAHRVSATQRTVRELLTARAMLVRTRARYIVLIRSLVRGHGLRIPSGARSTFVARVTALPAPAAVAGMLAPLLAQFGPLTQSIDALDTELATHAAADPVIARLRTVCGVGPVTALAFVSTLDTATRFTSAAQVAAYCGLVPSERSSGEQQRRGAITKAGNSRLRYLLVEAAVTLLRTQSPTTASLRAWADGIAQRRGRAIARVALARRLAGLLWVLWRDGTTYDATRGAPR